MNMQEWAVKWGIPQAALDDLCQSCVYTPQQTDDTDSPESVVQSQVRLEAPQKGCFLFRNNVGAGKLENGNFVRWGLANDSKSTNEVLKSADLIGVRKRLITQKDVGCYIGQFLSREIKPSSWQFKGSQRELAQLKWATLINSQGGDAQIVTGPGSL